MKKIKEYKGKLEIITVTFYEDTNDYCVIHSHPAIYSYWCKTRTDAIRYAHFLYAKY